MTVQATHKLAVRKNWIVQSNINMFCAYFLLSFVQPNERAMCELQNGVPQNKIDLLVFSQCGILLLHKHVPLKEQYD